MGIRLIIILPLLYHSTKSSSLIFSDSCIMAMISGWRTILRLNLYLANLLKVIQLKSISAIHGLNRTQEVYFNYFWACLSESKNFKLCILLQRLPCWDLQTPCKRNWNMLEPNLDFLAFKYNHCSLKIKMKFKMYPKHPAGNRKKKITFPNLSTCESYSCLDSWIPW